MKGRRANSPGIALGLKAVFTITGDGGISNDSDKTRFPVGALEGMDSPWGV